MFIENLKRLNLPYFKLLVLGAITASLGLSVILVRNIQESRDIRSRAQTAYPSVTFSASGFNAGESVSTWVTFSNGQSVGLSGQTANILGQVSFTVQAEANWPSGTVRVVAHGLQSNHEEYKDYPYSAPVVQTQPPLPGADLTPAECTKQGGAVSGESYEKFFGGVGGGCQQTLCQRACCFDSCQCTGTCGAELPPLPASGEADAYCKANENTSLECKLCVQGHTARSHCAGSVQWGDCLARGRPVEACRAEAEDAYNANAAGVPEAVKKFGDSLDAIRAAASGQNLTNEELTVASQLLASGQVQNAQDAVSRVIGSRGGLPTQEETPQVTNQQSLEMAINGACSQASKEAGRTQNYIQDQTGKCYRCSPPGAVACRDMAEDVCGNLATSEAEVENPDSAYNQCVTQQVNQERIQLQPITATGFFCEGPTKRLLRYSDGKTQEFACDDGESCSEGECVSQEELTRRQTQSGLAHESCLGRNMPFEDCYQEQLAKVNQGYSIDPESGRAYIPPETVKKGYCTQGYLGNVELGGDYYSCSDGKILAQSEEGKIRTEVAHAETYCSEKEKNAYFSEGGYLARILGENCRADLVAKAEAGFEIDPTTGVATATPEIIARFAGIQITGPQPKDVADLDAGCLEVGCSNIEQFAKNHCSQLDIAFGGTKAGSLFTFTDSTGKKRAGYCYGFGGDGKPSDGTSYWNEVAVNDDGTILSGGVTYSKVYEPAVYVGEDVLAAQAYCSGHPLGQPQIKLCSPGNDYAPASCEYVQYRCDTKSVNGLKYITNPYADLASGETVAICTPDEVSRGLEKCHQPLGGAGTNITLASDTFYLKDANTVDGISVNLLAQLPGLTAGNGIFSTQMPDCSKRYDDPFEEAKCVTFRQNFGKFLDSIGAPRDSFSGNCSGNAGTGFWTNEQCIALSAYVQGETTTGLQAFRTFYNPFQAGTPIGAATITDRGWVGVGETLGTGFAVGLGIPAIGGPVGLVVSTVSYVILGGAERIVLENNANQIAALMGRGCRLEGTEAANASFNCRSKDEQETLAGKILKEFVPGVNTEGAYNKLKNCTLSNKSDCLTKEEFADISTAYAKSLIDKGVGLSALKVNGEIGAANLNFALAAIPSIPFIPKIGPIAGQIAKNAIVAPARAVSFIARAATRIPVAGRVIEVAGRGVAKAFKPIASGARNIGAIVSDTALARAVGNAGKKVGTAFLAYDELVTKGGIFKPQARQAFWDVWNTGKIPRVPPARVEVTDQYSLRPQQAYNALEVGFDKDAVGSVFLSPTELTPEFKGKVNVVKQKLVEYFPERDVKGMYLVGSHSEGFAGATSDIDIVVMLDSLEDLNGQAIVKYEGRGFQFIKSVNPDKTFLEKATEWVPIGGKEKAGFLDVTFTKDPPYVFHETGPQKFYDLINGNWVETDIVGEIPVIIKTGVNPPTRVIDIFPFEVTDQYSLQPRQAYNAPDKNVINLEYSLGRPSGGSLSDYQIIGDSEVSRNHAKVTVSGRNVYIQDLGSNHGTIVNGKMISGIIELSPGDLIQVGRTKLRFRGLTEGIPNFERVSGPGALSLRPGVTPQRAIPQQLTQTKSQANYPKKYVYTAHRGEKLIIDLKTDPDLVRLLDQAVSETQNSWLKSGRKVSRLDLTADWITNKLPESEDRPAYKIGGGQAKLGQVLCTGSACREKAFFGQLVLDRLGIKTEVWRSPVWVDDLYGQGKPGYQAHAYVYVPDRNMIVDMSRFDEFPPMSREKYIDLNKIDTTKIQRFSALQPIGPSKRLNFGITPQDAQDFIAYVSRNILKNENLAQKIENFSLRNTIGNTFNNIRNWIGEKIHFGLGKPKEKE